MREKAAKIAGKLSMTQDSDQPVEDASAAAKAPMDLEAWLNVHGDGIAAAMYPDGDAPDDFKVGAIVKRHDRMVLKVVTQDQAALLKVFNSDETRGVTNNNRELALQLALKGTDLIPKIQAYDQAEKWVLSEWIDGTVLDRKVTEQNATDYARQLGHWFAEYTDVLDPLGGEKPTQWFSYLQNYRHYAQHLDYSPHQAVLEKMPICRRLIAKNDAYFGNFLVTEEGRLVGIDFEKSQLKPYGWDVMVTARVLVRKFPDMLPQVTDAIVDGWGRGTDCLDQSEFLELTRIFAASSAFVIEEDVALRDAQIDNADKITSQAG